MYAPAVAQQQASGSALIIGNDSPKSPYAHRDAAVFERFVLGVRGLSPDRVSHLRDATAAEITQALQSVRFREGSDVLVYFAGHSEREATGEQGPVDLVIGHIAGVRARTVQVFLETSLAGAADEGRLPLRVPGGAGNNVTALVAASPNETALTDEAGRQGLFTLHLLDALQGWADDNGDGQVTAAEVKAYLDDTMTPYARRELGANQTALLVGVHDAVLSAERVAPGLVAVPGPAASRAEPRAAPQASDATPWRVETELALRRDERRIIQLGLRAAGLAVGPIDGIFGRRTRAAIARWQAANGVAPSGYLDADGAATLLAAGEAAAPPTQPAPRELSPDES